MYNLSFAHKSIKKGDILNIHQYLMIENNIKLCLGLLTLICIEWVPEDPGTAYLVASSAQENARMLGFHEFPHFHARKHDIIILPEED